MPNVSIVIPSRNEPYLKKTIEDILKRAEGEIEIIAVLDGYWLPDPIENPKVIYIHHGKPKGMRGAINAGVAIAKGEYILKCDAHCMFDTGFDIKLTADCEKNWIVIPRRYALDAEKWKLTDNPKYPVDYMYLTPELHGEVWNEKNKDEKLKGEEIDDIMSSQGSCWFMYKDYFRELELEDEENYGTFSNEFQEIGLKCWLTGGRVAVNKKTWYAHLHKTEGRGYSLEGSQIEKGAAYTQRWLTNTAWHKQTLPFTWLIEKFWPVPGWPEDKTKWTL
jgi:glycosyltransferase involved in cell wall biosynthesis